MHRIIGGTWCRPSRSAESAPSTIPAAHQLIYDTGGDRVIAEGTVEIHYDTYILTANRVIYDQNTKKLIAEGNAELRDRNGSIVRADRLEGLDGLRDAFVRALRLIPNESFP